MMKSRALVLIACTLLLLNFGPAMSQVLPTGTTFNENHDTQTILENARHLAREKNYAAALVSYQEVLRNDPTNIIARQEVVEIALIIKNWSYAIINLNELIKLDPDNIPSRKLLMKIYRSFRLEIPELKVVYELSELEPGNIDILVRLVSLYDNHGMIAEKTQTLNVLHKLEPLESRWLSELADSYSRLNQTAKEMSAYKKLRKIQPGEPSILKRMGRRYGEIGNYSDQIACYTLIYDLADDKDFWGKVLTGCYEDAIRNYDFRFNLKMADKHCREYLRLHSSDQQVIRTAEELRTARKPTMNIEGRYHQYNFLGISNHLETTTTANTWGPVPGSTISLKNRHVLLNSMDGNRQAYFGSLSFKQRLYKFTLLAEAGLYKPIGGAVPKKGKFISELSLKHSGEKLSFTTSYKTDYVTLTLAAIENGVKMNQFVINADYFLTDRLNLSGGFLKQYYSDDNSGIQTRINLYYAIINSTFKTDDIEVHLPPGSDKTNAQVLIGLNYYYMDFKRESREYPTINREHVASLSCLFTKQVFPSWILSAVAYSGISNLSSGIWGYSISLTKHINWRSSLILEYENFISPYTFESERYINNENHLKFGYVSRF